MAIGDDGNLNVRLQVTIKNINFALGLSLNDEAYGNALKKVLKT